MGIRNCDYTLNYPIVFNSIFIINFKKLTNIKMAKGVRSKVRKRT